MTARDGGPGFPGAAAGARLTGSQAPLVHQPEIRSDGRLLMVTCSCLLTRTRGPEELARLRPENRPGAELLPRSRWERVAIETRTRFPAAEAVAAWRAWHEREGIAL